MSKMESFVGALLLTALILADGALWCYFLHHKHQCRRGTLRAVVDRDEHRRLVGPLVVHRSIDDDIHGPMSKGRCEHIGHSLTSPVRR